MMADFDWREWRRMQALHLSELGWKSRDIALAFDVTPGAVSQWLSSARKEGGKALQSHKRPGRPGKLTTEQKQLIPDLLWHGAEAYGFRGDLWTCLRIALILQQEFRVRYSKSEVSRLLKRIGWTPQVPLTRAIQRDEGAIERWKIERWPQLLECASMERRTLIFLDESGFYLLPGVAKTYAPQGQTPVVLEWQTRDHLSVMGAVTPQGKAYSLVRQKSLNGLHTIEFLIHLLRVAGERLLVIWDGSPIHRRLEVTRFLTQSARDSILVERLPPYAPEVNPVEWMWSYFKEVEMHNLVCLDLEQLHLEFHLAIGRLQQKPNIVLSFFKGAGLSL